MQGVGLMPRPCYVALLNIFEYNVLLQWAECASVIVTPQQEN